MTRERKIPASTSLLGAAGGTPRLVPEVGRLRVGARSQEQPEPSSPEQPSAKGGRKSSAKPGRPPRRRGRPRGPQREMLSVRILAENDRKLTQAVEVTGKNPQTIVDEALELYFKRLKIEDPSPGQGGGVA